MFITITGDLGSGKSTVGKLLAKRLNYNFLSIGDLMGEMASERGISLLELSKLAEESDEIDHELDKKQIELSKKLKDIVFDSRLGWYFVPNSIKIFLEVNLDEAAKRIFNDSRSDEKENISLESTKRNIIKRRSSEKKRYLGYYGVDHTKKDNFNIVIDTSSKSPEEIVDLIINYLDKIALNQK